jgi:hypothetical protein
VIDIEGRMPARELDNWLRYFMENGQHDAEGNPTGLLYSAEPSGPQSREDALAEIRQLQREGEIS